MKDDSKVKDEDDVSAPDVEGMTQNSSGSNSAIGDNHFIMMYLERLGFRLEKMEQKQDSFMKEQESKGDNDDSPTEANDPKRSKSDDTDKTATGKSASGRTAEEVASAPSASSLAGTKDKTSAGDDKAALHHMRVHLEQVNQELNTQLGEYKKQWNSGLENLKDVVDSKHEAIQGLVETVETLQKSVKELHETTNEHRTGLFKLGAGLDASVALITSMATTFGRLIILPCTPLQVIIKCTQPL